MENHYTVKCTGPGKTVKPKLMTGWEAREILKITADRATYTNHFGHVRIPGYVAYQAEGYTKPATKRATCRLCGEKVKTGLQLSFYYDEEDNPWTGKLYHVHADGCPTTPQETTI
jgi:hypothetical protein